MKFPRKDHLLFLALLLALVAVGVLVGRKYLLDSPPAPSVATTVEEPRVVREVRLYFGVGDSTYLAPETREMTDCLDDQACLTQTIEALVDGPSGALMPILPPNARVTSVAVLGGVAEVDFSRELVTGHPGGSVSELNTIYGLANTLAENFPHIRQVRILVEGQPVETLKGHVDLSGPIAADFRFVHRLKAQSETEVGSAEEIAEAADRQMVQPGAETDLPEGDAAWPNGEAPLPDDEAGLSNDDAPLPDWETEVPGDGTTWDDRELPTEEYTP